jgi:hypothetical protein
MKTIKKTLPVILLLITLAFIGSSCGSDDDTPNEPKKIRLTKFENSSWVYDIFYDNNNAITKYNGLHMSSGNSYEYPIHYDANNNVIRFKNRLYTYDSQDKMTQIKTLGPFAPGDASLIVSADGLMTSLTFTTLSDDLVVRTFTYNSDNQLIEFTEDKVGELVTQKSTITYDSKGNIVQIENGKINVLNQYTMTDVTAFTYDDTIKNPFFEIAKKLEKKPNQTSSMFSFFIGNSFSTESAYLNSFNGTYKRAYVSPNIVTSINTTNSSGANTFSATYTINSTNSQNYPTAVSVSASSISSGNYGWDEIYTYEEY